MFDLVYRPGVALGHYPERKNLTTSKLEAFVDNTVGQFSRSDSRQLNSGRQFIKTVESLAESFTELSDDEFKARCFDIRLELQRSGYEVEVTAQAFAAIREASGRLLGKHHFHSQLLGGWALLKGHVAEMQTGEGKTITTLLPACTAAMAGVPVHVVTANDYLAARDAESLIPVFEWFGLTVGVLDPELNDPAQRKAAYECNVLYCSPNQIAFDYLKDRMTMGNKRKQLDHNIRGLSDNGGNAALLMRGLCFAIVDEADSVLIDDACTPLILSQQSGDPPAAEPYVWALRIANALILDEDIEISRKYRDVSITETGRERLAALIIAEPAPADLKQSAIEDLVKQALQGLHCYRGDRDYIVREGRIEIIDSNTGRAQPDTAWERGLHQMIEAKEQCELTAPRSPMARMSYQRFFQRYLHLSGMSGTALEVADELWSVYRLQVVTIPPNRENRRRGFGSAVFTTATSKWQAVTKCAIEMRSAGRATLIGTNSLEESEYVSQILTEAGLEHSVLNARQDKQEAEIVAHAGETGAVMVATNMAGRGTDIPLIPSVKDAGGLHVIVAGRNNSHRVDRQLIGRCARQGDPGSWQEMLSLEDELLKEQLSPTLLLLSRYLYACGIRWAARLAIWSSQRMAERHGKAQRLSVLRFDEQSKERLGFSGPME